VKFRILDARGRIVFGGINLKIDLRLLAKQWLLPVGLILLAMVVGSLAWQDFTKAKVVVEWTTASELSTIGFNLYRSDLENGLYVIVNEVLIPASPDPLTGGNYTYIDNKVKAGSTYYYQLEDVEADGSTSRYGPIRVRAQRGGSIELLLAIASLAIGVFVIVLLLKRRKDRHEFSQE